MSNSLHAHQHLKNKSSITQAPLPANNSHILNITNPPIIRDVWEDNFEEEFAVIMNLAEQYKVIGMDTEFPGIVYRLNEADLSQLSSIHEIEYKTIKINTDNLKVIQVGLSFANEEGHLLDSVTSWQFNFRFDLNKDEYANDAVDLLVNSGIKFEEHASRGINPQRFAEYLIASGILFNEEIKWISFHGGFDFAYLIRMLHGQNLPDDEQGFYNLLNIYFPSFFDIKYMVRDLESLKSGGLNKIANELNVRRIGPQHQAGSDSLLTLATYFKLKGAYFKNSPDGRYANVLYGIGSNGEEGLNDYVWQNFVSQDYTSMMYNGYGMGGMSVIDPYYSQADNVYSNHYNMSYATANYSNYGPSSYMDANNKFKKYEMYTGKAKN